jgi:hypothetical protein
MTRDPKDDFENPLVADGSPHKTHVLYRLAAPPGITSERSAAARS